MEYELEKYINENNLLLRENELKKIQIETYENQISRMNATISMNTIYKVENVQKSLEEIDKSVPEGNLIPSFKDINNMVFHSDRNYNSNYNFYKKIN